MKQHITLQQLDELPLKSKVLLREWCIEQKYCGLDNDIRVLADMQLLIGQMIEYLAEKNRIIISNNEKGWYVEGEQEKELCDCLWEAVKQVLESSEEE